jgi:hypothetical protein
MASADFINVMGGSSTAAYYCERWGVMPGLNILSNLALKIDVGGIVRTLPPNSDFWLTLDGVIWTLSDMDAGEWSPLDMRGPVARVIRAARVAGMFTLGDHEPVSVSRALLAMHKPGHLFQHFVFELHRGIHSEMFHDFSQCPDTGSTGPMAQNAPPSVHRRMLFHVGAGAGFAKPHYFDVHSLERNWALPIHVWNENTYELTPMTLNFYRSALQPVVRYAIVTGWRLGEQIEEEVSTSVTSVTDDGDSNYEPSDISHSNEQNHTHNNKRARVIDFTSEDEA